MGRAGGTGACRVRGSRPRRGGALPGGHPHCPPAAARSRGCSHHRRQVGGRIPCGDLCRSRHPAHRHHHPALRDSHFLCRGPGGPWLTHPRHTGLRPPDACCPAHTSSLVGQAAERPPSSTPSSPSFPPRNVSSRSRTPWSFASPSPTPSASRRRELGDGNVTIRDLVRHTLRHRPDHIVVGEVRGAEAADLLQALNTGHGGSLTTIHANNATSALSRLASCAMQAGDLPWEVVCRGVVDGIALILHITARDGRRYVEESLELCGWRQKDNAWLTAPAYDWNDRNPTASDP